MKNKFERICKMTQKNLKKYVSTELKKTHPDVQKGDGWVFAKGTFPVLLVAHLDTVHHELPRNIVYDFDKGTVSSPQGIGGDDRCGILMILEIVKAYNCSVLFCEDEEIGCVGAGKFIKTDLAASLEFNYIIEFDRKGSNDAVFYECDNPDFEEFITKEFYKTAYGSMSDISELAPFLGCAAVNLSCGYYNAHTTKEYVVFKEMISSMNAACRILDRTTTETKFEYIEAEYSYGGWGSYRGGYSKDAWQRYFKDSYGYEEEEYEKYYMIEFEDENGKTSWYDTYATSKEEAIGIFCISHLNIPYANVIDIYCMDDER